MGIAVTLASCLGDRPVAVDRDARTS